MNYRSKTTAMMLCLFFGFLGAHWFYLGRPKWGQLYLALCLAPWPVGFWVLMLFASWAPAVVVLSWVAAWAACLLLTILTIYDFFCLLSMAPPKFDLDYNSL